MNERLFKPVITSNKSARILCTDDKAETFLSKLTDSPSPYGPQPMVSTNLGNNDEKNSQNLGDHGSNGNKKVGDTICYPAKYHPALR